MKNFKEKKIIRKVLSIFIKIMVIIFILVALMHLVQEMCGILQHQKRKIRVEKSYMTNVNKGKIDDLSNYVLINKNCTSCINNRKGNAGCVVVKDKKILLVKYRRTNQISLPGGFRDYKHRDTFIASEEMRNALGYVVSIEDIISDFEYLFRLSSDSLFRLYKCNIIKTTNKTNDKILEEKWVSKQELKEILDKTDKEVAFKDELQLVYDKFEFITK